MVALLGAMTLAACGNTPSLPERSAPGVQTGKKMKVLSRPPAPLTVDAVVQQGMALQGRDLKVAGRYMGWNGQCQGTPASRSAWMLEGKSECVYVSGQVPDGLAPPPAQEDVGQEVVVEARVAADQAGRLYLVTVHGSAIGSPQGATNGQ